MERQKFSEAEPVSADEAFMFFPGAVEALVARWSQPAWSNAKYPFTAEYAVTDNTELLSRVSSDAYNQVFAVWDPDSQQWHQV